MTEILEKTNFNYVKALALCKFDKAFNCDINFNSKIPNSLGYQNLKKGTNIAEGIIIRPTIEHTVKNKNNQNVRYLIKRKN